MYLFNMHYYKISTSTVPKAWKFKVIKHLEKEFLAIWFMVFLADCYSWKSDVLDWVIRCFHHHYDMIGIPF